MNEGEPIKKAIPKNISEQAQLGDDDN